MNYSISLLSRNILLFVLLFICVNSYGQTKASEALYDSIINLRPFPEAPDALPLFERLYAVSEAEENKNLEVFSLLYVSYYYDFLGNDVLSDELTEQAFELVRDTTNIDISNTIMAYQWMQQLVRKRGNLIYANDINKKYVELELASGANNVDIGISYLELASGCRILGDYENAILYPTMALELFEEAPDSLFSKTKDKYLRLWRSLQIRGLAYKDLKNYDSAVEDYILSLEYLKKSKHFDETTGLNSQVNTFARLAQVHLLNEDLPNAINALKNLKPLLSKSNHNPYLYYEHSTALALKRKEYNAAKDHIQKAISRAEKSLKGDKAHPEIARLQMLYGDYFSALKDYRSAIVQYHKGLQYFDGKLTDATHENPDISEVSEGLQTLQLLERKANAFLKIYEESNDLADLQHSVSTYNTAIDLIEKKKRDFINEGSKYRVTEIASELYPKALEANFLLQDLKPDDSTLNSIFAILENNKAEILFQNINSKYQLITSSLPANLIQQGIDLNTNIAYYSKLLAQEKLKDEVDTVKVEQYDKKLFKLKEALTFYDQNIKTNFPDYFDFKNEFNKSISVEDVQQALIDDQLIVEYLYTDEQLYILTISNQSVSTRKLATDEIEPLLMAYHKAISLRPIGTSFDKAELDRLSFEIASKLVLDDSNYQASVTHLIVIPDGLVARVPFESMMVDENGTLFLETCSISYNYSTRQYLENRTKEILSDPSVLCLTPSFDGYTSDERNCNSEVLGDIPNTKKEFDNLKANFNGVFLEGEGANSTNLKDHFADHAIIHLSTHACFNDDDPMLSKIYFSDGALTNYDIQNLNSRPELVVLSACNTASGELREGEGVIGLSRGFFQAGVKSLQSSLWSIDDYSSSEIVQGMYKHLKEGKSKSESLRLAKMDYLKSADKLRSHPYFWAALIHIGNDNPIEFRTFNSNILIYGALSVVICLLVFYIYRRNKRG